MTDFNEIQEDTEDTEPLDLDVNRLTVRHLELVDAQGERRGVFTTSEETGLPYLAIGGNNPDVMISLMIGEDDTPSIGIRGSNDDQSIILSILPSGDVFLNLNNAGDRCLMLSVSDDDMPDIHVCGMGQVKKADFQKDPPRPVPLSVILPPAGNC